jgi:hypothetical protein
MRFPLIISAKISFPELWYIFEDNGKVKHYYFLDISLMQQENYKGLEIIVGWLAIAIAWIGFSKKS